MIKLIKFFTYLFLTLIVCALVGMGGYQAFDLIFSRTIKPEYVPFGLDIGTELDVGRKFSVPKELPKLDPADQKLYKQAIQYHEMRGVKSSKKIFDGLIKKYPEVFAIYFYASKNILSYQELTKSLLDDVRVYIQQAKALNPEHPALYFITGQYNLLMNNNDQALKSFEKSIELSPIFAPSYYELALINLQGKKYSSSLEYLKYSITLDTESLEKQYSMLAHIYHNTADLDTCFRVVNYAIDQFPYNTSLLYLKGLLLEYDGDVDEARETYNKILKLDPQNSEAQKAITTLGQKIPPIKSKPSVEGSSVNSIALLDSLVNDRPKNGWLRYALGVAYLNSGNSDKAEIEFDKARLYEASLQTLNSEGKTFEVANAKKKEVVKPVIKKSSKELALEKQVKEMISQSENKVIEVKKKKSVLSEGKVELGHFLVPWGATEKEFFKRYPISDFKKIKYGIYKETFYVDDILHEHVVRFNKKGFWGVHVYLTDTTKAYIDLLGSTIRANARISGSGTHLGEKKCPGFKSFESFTWNKTKDNYELITQFAGKSWQVRMMRMSPDQYKQKPISICSVIPRLVEFKTR
ncbi:MAG: tetratricopeptide repeat protein [Fibrobacterales bacterium]